MFKFHFGDEHILYKLDVWIKGPVPTNLAQGRYPYYLLLIIDRTTRINAAEIKQAIFFCLWCRYYFCVGTDATSSIVICYQANPNWNEQISRKYIIVGLLRFILG